jgi:hypothetical protein
MSREALPIGGDLGFVDGYGRPMAAPDRFQSLIGNGVTVDGGK